MGELALARKYWLVFTLMAQYLGDNANSMLLAIQSLYFNSNIHVLLFIGVGGLPPIYISVHLISNFLDNFCNYEMAVLGPAKK